MYGKKTVIPRTGQVPIHKEMHGFKEPVASNRGLETNQIKTASIVRTSPPSQEFMPLGYNRENILDRVARADFWGFNVAIDPNFVGSQANGQNRPVNFEQFARSITVSNGINSNQFIWDPIPELENFPVSGFPEQVSQQYVMYNVQPGYVQQAMSAMHVTQQSVPTAYNAASPTSKQATYTYQVPVSDLVNSMSGSTFFQRLKKVLFGG